MYHSTPWLGHRCLMAAPSQGEDEGRQSPPLVFSAPARSSGGERRSSACMRVCLCACEDSTDSRNPASLRCLYMARYDTQEMCHRKGAATCLRRPSARPSSHGVHSCVMALRLVSDSWESVVYLPPAAGRKPFERSPSSRMICPPQVTPAVPESFMIWSPTFRR